MKKVSLAFYNDEFPESAIEFICRMNEASPVFLTAVSLQKQDADLPVYSDGTFGMFLPLTQRLRKPATAATIERLEAICIENGIEYKIEEDTSELTFSGLQKESRFSDLLVMGSDMLYNDSGSKSINVMMEDLLHNINCPALLIPAEFEYPTSLVLAYDGSKDCVFAIRQFAALFPQLLGLNTLLAYINGDENKEIPFEKEIEDLACASFRYMTFCKIDSKKHFSDWIRERRGSMLVCGSYGRSALSQLIRKSFARNIITNSQVPVFIAHL